MRRILVTGATGFVGGAVLRELRGRGAKVLAASSADADLRDPAAARELVRRARPDVVLHAAGALRGEWESLWDRNVTTTVNLAQALAPGARLVVVGSGGEYGNAAGRRRAREDGPAEPLTTYGCTKLAQTLAALSFRHRGLRVTAARLFNLTGPGQPEGNVPGAWLRQLRQGAAEVRVGGLSAYRDFLDVRDAARALADLCGRDVPDGVYNVCSGEAVKMEAALRLLLALWGRPVKVVEDATRRRAVEVPFSAGDPSKLIRATGWKRRIGLERSIRDALAA